MSSTATARQSLLITPAALSENLHNAGSKVKILDATWFMPNLVPPRDPYKEFLAGPRIKGATAFWGVDDVADKTHPLGLPHMLPTAERFAEACSQFGIERDSEVVVYDTHSVFSAPRTVFTFKTFGHPRAYVLDGGLPRWTAEGYPTEDGQYTAKQEKSSYEVPASEGSNLRSYEQISKNASLAEGAAEAELVLDARPNGRFTGADAEPRLGMSSGHMPHSVSLPFVNLLSQPSKTTPSYKTLLPTEELRSVILKAIGGNEQQLQSILDGKTSVVSSCGSGMTAAIIWLALQELGVKSAVYDESWVGYASRKESKILKD